MRIELAAWSEAWAVRYAAHAARVVAALGAGALRVEHVGSTSVRGLHAKPVIDVLVEVADPSDEPAYVPALEAAGYVFRLREPDWHQHRLLRWEQPRANVHVFSRGSAEAERMVTFRDHLRADRADRDLYASTKAALAAREWASVDAYAQAKSDVVADILSRARRGMS